MSAQGTDRATPMPEPHKDAAVPVAAGAADPAGRVDLQLIATLIPRHARVLDVGCGDGSLLHTLRHEREVDGRGIEINRDRVAACLNQGLSVIQGDAEADLKDYPSGAFDCVILSQTLQAVHHPKAMLQDLLRIGNRAVISITNGGYWKNRLTFLTEGRVPFNIHRSERWYDTPNIHPCTLRDCVELIDELGLVIESCYAVRASGTWSRIDPKRSRANLLAVQAILLLRA